MPVAVHGVEQEAVGDLPPAAGAPLPGEGARRDRGRLRAAAGVHHGLRGERGGGGSALGRAGPGPAGAAAAGPRGRGAAAQLAGSAGRGGQSRRPPAPGLCSCSSQVRNSPGVCFAYEKKCVKSGGGKKKKL